MTLIIPKALQPGATIAFISPSLRINNDYPAVMQRATAVLEGRGYKVRTFFNQDTGIQSSISNRLSEIREAFTDSNISAIICTIGGNTFSELLPSLISDTELHAAIRAHPKIVVGYSDITGLHWFLNSVVGLRSFYGPGAIPELGGVGDPADGESPVSFCVKHLFRVIESNEPIGDIARSPLYAPRVDPFWKDPGSTEKPELAPAHAWRWIRGGKAEGRLFGGCLTVADRLQGVRPLVPDWRGRIVFLETSLADHDLNAGKPINRVQAGFADLIAGGVFEEAAGLVVGRPYGYNSPEEQEQYANVIKGLFCEGRLAEKKFPILFNVDIGHTVPMVTLPYDALAVLNSENDRFAILESGVL